MEIITGTIANVKFHHNDYLIARLNDGTMVKGTMPSVQFGLEYIFEGRWKTHPKFGRSLEFDCYRTTYPKDLNAIRNYLLENCKWIGKEISKKLVNAYGEKTLDVCKKEPKRVADEISGITLDRAMEISLMLVNNERDEELHLQLKTIFEGISVSKRVIARIIKQYGQEAIAKIKEKPYKLIEDIDGVGFLTADKIAIRIGYEKAGRDRIRAGIYHILGEESSMGHTCLPIQLLVEKVSALLVIDNDIVKLVINYLITQNPPELIAVSIKDEDSYLYIPAMYENEFYIAEKLKKILTISDAERGAKEINPL